MVGKSLLQMQTAVSGRRDACREGGCRGDRKHMLLDILEVSAFSHALLRLRLQRQHPNPFGVFDHGRNRRNGEWLTQKNT